MTRSSGLVASAAVLALVLALLALLRPAVAGDGPAHRIAYLYVSGQGPQAKAWYDGAPPAGVQVQSALDRFAGEGYRFASIVSSGRTPFSVAGGAPPTGRLDDAVAADYVVILER